MGIFVKSIAAVATDEEQRERSRRRNELCVYIYTRTVLLSFSFPFALLAVANLLSWVVGLFYAARKKKDEEKEQSFTSLQAWSATRLYIQVFYASLWASGLRTGRAHPVGEQEAKPTCSR